VRAWRWSVLAWQVDHVVGEVQRDFIQRKIRVLDLFGERDIAIAIVARQRSGSVGTYGELPDLKFFGGNTLRFSLWKNRVPVDVLPLEGWIELELLAEEDLLIERIKTRGSCDYPGNPDPVPVSGSRAGLSLH
jgi:hypothetical protein